MIVWEYSHYLFEPGEKMMPKLNEMGAKGWEAFHFITEGQPNRGTRVLFKRPKPTPTEEQSK